MPSNVHCTIAYLVLCHVLLFSTSPSYKHELGRVGAVAWDWTDKLSFGWLGKEQNPAWRLPRSGIYRSSDLLQSIQGDMVFNASQGTHKTDGLVAYMSASDAIKGQGWKVRATLFVMLMAPRYTLLPLAHPSLKPQLKLLSLAAADLPAVGRLAGSEDASIGYKLTCSSPALHLSSMGPQPFANCSVWANPATPQLDTKPQLTAAAAGFSGSASTAAAAVCSSCPAAFGLHTAMQGAVGGCSPAARSSSEAVGGGGAAARASMPAEKPIAYWIVVLSNVDLAAAAPSAGAAGEALSGAWQQQLPLLGGPSFYEPPPGGLLSLMAATDTWFIFPRTPLLRLLPAMTGLQQLAFAHAVAIYTWHDLLHIITAMQQLHTRMRLADPFRARSWNFATAACSVALQLLVLLASRLVVSTVLAFGAISVLYQLLRAVKLAAALLHLPTLKWVGLLLKLRGAVLAWLGLRSTAAAAAGAVETTAAAAAGVDGSVLVGSTAAAAAGPFSRSSSFWRFGGSVAVKAAGLLGLRVDDEGTAAAARVLRRFLLPWHPQLLALHYLCQDLVLLTNARLVWELQEILFDVVWRLLVLLGVEVQILLECSAAGLGLLRQGGSWSAAWARFNQMQQMQQQRRAEAVAAAGGGNAAAVAAGGGGQNNHIQAQVFLQAPLHADMGQAAEALRVLADELEQLAPMGWVAGRAVRRPRVKMLGSHWPAALDLPFDAEEVQAELGGEVPRGFICPITQDIMKLPALLISSTVEVPATYDKEAISKWLEDNRRDPKSRQVLAADAQLVPNMDLYRSIEHWAAQKQAEREQRAAAAVAAAAGTAAGAGQDDPAAAEAEADAGPRPSSSLLAALRGAAAAGLGAARRSRSRSLGQAGPDRLAGEYPAAAAAAAAADDDDDADADEPLLSDEEVEGPSAAALRQQQRQRWLGPQMRRPQRRGMQCGDSGRVRHRVAGADQHEAAVEQGQGGLQDAVQGGLQEGQQQQEQEGDGDGAGQSSGGAGRYNLRRRRGSTPAAVAPS